VNPEDERHRAAIGTKVRLPLTDRVIPVIADGAVSAEFGTGAVKVTPAHDPNDFDIGERHQLKPVVALDERGRMTEVAGALAGLDRYEARKKALAMLESEGLLERTEAHTHAVGRCQRCDTVV